MIYRFMLAEKADFPVRFMCARLGVSPSGFYDFTGRPPSRREVSDRELTQRIVQIWESSRGTYGSPRIFAELCFEGHRISRKRVARLMRVARIQGVHVRRRYRTTRRAAGIAPAPDLVARRFSVEQADRIWAADITYVRTGEGFLHLAAVMDLHSRKVVGWAMAPHLRTELVVDALEMAISRRRPRPGLVHHSDQGTQYTSLAFGRRLREAGVLASMGAVGTAYDNAVVESFFGTLKTELVHRSWFATRQQVRSAIFEWIEVFYNRQRRHSTLGQLSPAEFEGRYVSSLKF